MSVSQQVNDAATLCQDPDTKGFDLQAGQSWVYPTNYSVRDYQFNIIQQALHKNTLVSLPTGLGKTFIAAVVMYNFYRWYPHGKVIFMAPTRPLVKQQMDACYNITAIPQEVTAELTGTKAQQSRTEIWYNQRVFFITPQVLQNDLAIIIELGAKIKCLVFDEAHKAKGNHAYCEVIRKLLPKNKLFRVLALSATPGNSSKDVIDVMQNLLIAHVEFRSEESPDVKPYVFERALETVVVPLGEKLQQVKELYVQILEKYTRTLIQYKVIYGNCINLTKGKIFMIMKEFQKNNSGGRTPNYSEIMKSLNICVTLYHAYETLIRCGLRAFLNFYEEHINNPLISNNMSLRQILEDLRKYLGPNAEVQSLPDGTFTKVPASTKFGHPKLYKLRDILFTHFKHSDCSTRVIVFFEYRESAAEAYALLTQSYPTLKPRVFVGQGPGVTQKDQINTIKAFRDGNCNTLLSTCIGEEGLDVGDVDLIVCFDVASKSPIRMIQRMGRTGRKKEGRVVVLVTEGKEQQTLKECLIYKNNLGNFVSNSEYLEPGKYQDNPKMIPSYIQPKCQKMYITVKKPTAPKKSGNLKNMLKNIASGSSKYSEDVDVIEITERIKNKIENLWDKEYPLEFNFEEPKINFKKHIEKQRKAQIHGDVKHSKQTDIFVSLLQFADSKRFNLPITQESGKFGIQNKFLKQGDIRSMFSKPVGNILSQEAYIPSQYLSKEKDATQSFPSEFFEEISTYLSINMSIKRTCKTCDHLFECPQFGQPESEKIDLSSIVIPDLSVLDGISSKDWEVFADSLSPKSKDIYHDFLEDDIEAFDEIIFNDEFADETVLTHNRSLTYETPRNFEKILKSFRICEDEEDETFAKDIEEKSFGFQNPNGFDKVKNLLGNSLTKKFENDEMVDLERSHVSNHTKKVVVNKTSHEGVLAFFKLASLADMFVDTEPPCSQDSDTTVIFTQEMNPQKSPSNVSSDLFGESPDLFPSPPSEKKQSNHRTPESPTLCSYERVVALQAKKRLFNETKEEEVRKKPRLSNLNLQRKSFFESTRRKSVESPKRPTAVLDISDICDIDSFMKPDKKKEKAQLEPLYESRVLTEKKESKREEKSSFLVKTSGKEFSKIEEKHDLDINSLCDMSVFGLPGPSSTHTVQKNSEHSGTTKVHKAKQSEKLSRESKTGPVGGLGIEDICDLSSFFGQPLEAKKAIKTSKVEDMKVNRVDLEEFCDMSFFMSSQKKKSAESTKVHVDDFCDMPFGNTTKKKLKSDEVCGTSSKKLTKKSTATNLNDFYDMSFMNTPKTKPTNDFCATSSAKSTNSTLMEINDFCDMSFFTNTTKKKPAKSTINNLRDKSSEKPTNSAAANLNDFCDMSFFADTSKNKPKNTKDDSSNKSSEKSTKNSPASNVDAEDECMKKTTHTEINENKQKDLQKEIIIDLTDSDLEFSPLKIKQTEANKPLTQLSITQLLSVVAKSNDLTNSQKENTFSPRAKTQKRHSAKKKILQLKQNVETPKSQKPKKHDAITSKTKKSPLNISLPTDSDDEFEDSFRSPIFTKPEPVSSQAKKKQKVRNPQDKKRKKLFSNFIEEEADVSIEKSVIISEDEDSDEDCYEASFVADETQDVLNATNMQAKYLQSVKSPVRRGVFKIPEKFKHNISNVFSQEVSNEDNTYLNDSFCVNDYEEVHSENSDVSELDLLEKRLKEMKKNKKRKKSSEDANSKRRRIIVVSDDSD